MWEIDIIINYKYRKYLMYLKENITSSNHYNQKGVFAIFRIDNNATLSIAILEPSIELKEQIIGWIAECLIFSEKDNYIRNKKCLPNTEFKNAFLKALIMVDMTSDINMVSSVINLDEKTINLHSLFRFRLKNLITKWDKMIERFFPKDESRDNGKLMDILKSIINSNRKILEITIRHKESGYILESDTDNIYILASDEADAIANLILLSPSSIKITCKDNITSDSLILIEFLFENIVSII